MQTDRTELGVVPGILVSIGVLAASFGMLYLAPYLTGFVAK